MVYRFGAFELDLAGFTLRRDGAEAHVEPQVFDMIRVLVEARGALVSYDQLIAEVWHGRIVSDATIAARVSAARTALGDSGKAQAVIRTVPRRGIQLLVPVEGAEVRPAPAHTARQTVRFAQSADGTGLAWASSGTGPPILRGGHWISHLELDWDSPVWRPLLDRLSDGRRLVRYDPRGTGLSDRDVPGFGLDALVDDMAAVADAAGLDRAPIFAASQSVPVALGYAARYPDRVSRMVLLNGFVRGDAARGDPAKADAMVAMIRSGWGQGDSPFMKAFATVFAPDASEAELASLVEIQAQSARPEEAAALRRAIASFDVEAVLPRVSAPVLVMHATGDAVQPLSEGRALAAGLPDARFRQYGSRNHITLPSDPMWDTICSEAEAFLDGGPNDG